MILASRIDERGERYVDEPADLSQGREHEPVVIETRVGSASTTSRRSIDPEFGTFRSSTPASRPVGALCSVLVGAEAIGRISLQNLDREHAFTEDDAAAHDARGELERRAGERAPVRGGAATGERDGGARRVGP